MALIQCPNCGGKVSTEAAACPHCGSGVAVQEKTRKNPGSKPAKERRNTKPLSKKTVIAGIAVLAVAVAVAVIVSMVSGDMKYDKNDFSEEFFVDFSMQMWDVVEMERSRFQSEIEEIDEKNYLWIFDNGHIYKFDSTDYTLLFVKYENHPIDLRDYEEKYGKADTWKYGCLWYGTVNGVKCRLSYQTDIQMLEMDIE